MMKKMVSLILALWMIGSVFPVSAADAAEEVYHAYMQPQYEAYELRREAFLERYPNAANDWQQTYEAYCAANPAESFAEFSCLGTCADESASIWLIAPSYVFGDHSEFVGDYIMEDHNLHTDEQLGLCVYADGALIYLADAYEQGIISDTDLEKLFAQKTTAGDVQLLRLIGDVDLNDAVDVSDVVALKERIMKMTLTNLYGEGNRSRMDVDKSGYIDVGDIMALKALIMAA